MAALVWDDTGNKLFETGTDRGVLYPYASSAYGAGVAWDGLRSFNESPTGAEETALYANNGKYGSLRSAEEFEFTIGAYTSPEAFDECDGTKEIATGAYATQQNRKMFGFSARTLVGNDTDSTDYGYKIHLCYGATASPTSREHSTVNDSPEAEELSWECKTTPVPVPGGKPSAHLIIRSWKISAEALAALEAVLYGDATHEPRLPLPSEVAEIVGIADGSIGKDTFTGDGTTTEFTLTKTSDGDPISVTVDGVAATGYTFATNKITFSTAPAASKSIVVIYNVAS